jgi:hypothetical protein
MHLRGRLQRDVRQIPHGLKPTEQANSAVAVAPHTPPEKAAGAVGPSCRSEGRLRRERPRDASLPRTGALPKQPSAKNPPTSGHADTTPIFLHPVGYGSGSSLGSLSEKCPRNARRSPVWRTSLLSTGSQRYWLPTHPIKLVVLKTRNIFRLSLSNAELSCPAESPTRSEPRRTALPRTKDAP